MNNNEHSNEMYIGTIVLKCNTVFIEPDKKEIYNIKYLGDSSKLCGGDRVLFELDEKISNYVYTAKIVKVLDNSNKDTILKSNKTLDDSSNQKSKVKVKLRQTI